MHLDTHTPTHIHAQARSCTLNTQSRKAARERALAKAAAEQAAAVKAAAEKAVADYAAKVSAARCHYQNYYYMISSPPYFIFDRACIMCECLGESVGLYHIGVR